VLKSIAHQHHPCLHRLHLQGESDSALDILWKKAQANASS